jgi:hypothetical protein
MRTDKGEAEGFRACTRSEADELKRKSDDLMDEYNSVVRNFHRRARG